jgi:hypothetical protein
MIYIYALSTEKRRISQSLKYYLGSLIKSVARCTREIKSWAAVAIEAFNKQQSSPANCTYI